MAFATKLKRAKGLGTASGYHHWSLHRTTGLLNVPLMLWAIITVATSPLGDYYEAVRFLQQPMNALLMILFVVNAFIHFFLCIQLVIEDYVHHELAKTIGLLGFKIACSGCAIASVFAILTTYLKGVA